MERSQLIANLQTILGADKVLDDKLDMLSYSYDSSFKARNNRYIPDVVVTLTSTDEVSKVMQFAYEHNVPVTPRGAGTGETCGALAIEGGIVIDLGGWDVIEEVDAENMQVQLRPGVIHADLNKYLAAYGLFFPPDPGSSQMCTVGGMVANNSSGLRAVKYGTTEQYVLGLEIVLPNGQVIITGGVNSRAIKNVSGLNLTKLFIGSEGTLGIVTKIRLRLWPKPKSRGILMAVYDDLEEAPKTVLEVYKAGILPSGIEILDASAIKAVNEYKPEIALPNAEAILLFELDGNPASVEWEGNEVTRIVNTRAVNAEWSTDPERMAKLWQGRAVTATAAARLRADGSRIFAGEDISIPLNQVTESIKRIKALGAKYGIGVVNYGHIGDGNVHTAPVINPEDPKEVELANKLVDEIHLTAIELGGTTTGEHGIGAVRSQYARQEHGAALDVMYAVKKALDPKGIMNPGKLLPKEGDNKDVSTSTGS